MSTRFKAIFFLVIGMMTVSAVMADSVGDRKVVRYSIESVFCSGCVSGLKAVVGEIEGVESISVDVEEHSLTVVFDSKVMDEKQLQARITEETTFKLVFIDVNEAITDEDA